MAKKNYRSVKPPAPVNSARRRAVRSPTPDERVVRQSGLEFLSSVLKQEKQWEREVRKAVEGARKRGASWEEIGRVMGLATATVHGRYSGKVAPTRVRKRQAKTPQSPLPSKSAG